jgi:hypothetical protein
MKAIFANIDFTKIFATCLVARLVIAGALAAPRLFAVVAGIYAVLLLARLINSLIQKLAGVVAKMQWKTLASPSFPIAKTTQFTTR